jgi:hypothetical protein
MKRVFLIITTSVLISTSGTCQWYHRQFGANNIFQLTPEQFNESLISSKKGVRNGTLISAAGVIGILGGTIEILATKNIGEGFGILVGAGLLAVSVPLEITGLTIWGTYSSRENTIKEILKNAEIKLVMFNHPKGLGYSESFATAGFSMVFRF